jgi:hypothetical protein
MRALKFVGLVLVNVVVAVIGTAILDTEIWKLVPIHSVAGILWKELVLSVICATLIGFAMWRTWRNSAAMWTWILPTVWFAFGCLATAGDSNFWGTLFPFGSGSLPGKPEVRGFFLFTVPMVRAVSYSVGAYLSSRLYSKPAVPPETG